MPRRPAHSSRAEAYRRARKRVGPSAAPLSLASSVNQPFRLLEGVTQADFKEGDKLFLKGRVEGYGVRLWKLTVRDVRSGGKDVVLECDAEG